MKKAEIGDMVLVTYPEAESWNGEGRITEVHYDEYTRDYIYIVEFDRVHSTRGGFEPEFITNISNIEIWDLEI